MTEERVDRDVNPVDLVLINVVRFKKIIPRLVRRDNDRRGPIERTVNVLLPLQNIPLKETRKLPLGKIVDRRDPPGFTKWREEGIHAVKDIAHSHYRFYRGKRETVPVFPFYKSRDPSHTVVDPRAPESSYFFDIK